MPCGHTLCAAHTRQELVATVSPPTPPAPRPSPLALRGEPRAAECSGHGRKSTAHTLRKGSGRYSRVKGPWLRRYAPADHTNPLTRSTLKSKYLNESMLS